MQQKKREGDRLINEADQEGTEINFLRVFKDLTLKGAH